MKYNFLLLFFTLILSCEGSSEKPKNLLSKDEIAEILADLAIYNQVYLINPREINFEAADKFVLQKHNINAKNFRESYEYYTYTPSSLDDIYNKAKKIILEKDPQLKNQLKKEKKQP